MEELLSPIMAQSDGAVQAALSSQTALSEQLERVSRQLQHFLTSLQLPAFSPHTKKLAEARRRLSAMNVTLLQVQARLVRLEQLCGARDGTQHPVTSSTSGTRTVRLLQWEESPARGAADESPEQAQSITASCNDPMLDERALDR